MNESTGNASPRLLGLCGQNKWSRTYCDMFGASILGEVESFGTTATSQIADESNTCDLMISVFNLENRKACQRQSTPRNR